MFIEANTVERNKTLKSDVCVIGAGAAGITLAEKFRRAGLNVILLEAGGLEPTAETFEMYEGEMVKPYHRSNKDYLSTSRLRYFGGTSNHWAGWCRPLDPVVFGTRKHLDVPGWPITHSDMVPYYKAVAEWIDTGDLLTEAMPKGRPVVPLDDSLFETRLFHHSTWKGHSPTRFGQKYRDAIKGAPNVKCLLGAMVTSVNRKAGSEKITSCTVQTLEKNRFTVQAKHFILSAGGIENARLLLLSTSTDAQGLGNGTDNVGRYFADHPEYGFYYRSRVVFAPGVVDPKKTFKLYDRPRGAKSIGGRVRGIYWLRDDVALKEKILQIHGQVRDAGHVDAVEEDKAMMNLLGISAEAKEPKATIARIVFRVEPAPNRLSTVTLDPEKKDALGLPRARVDWQLTALDKRTFERGQTLMAEAIARAGWGRARMQLPLSNKRPFNKVTPGKHHMGTTRMAAREQDGVVDDNARVFGTQNLFCAGSSIFPVFGASNPTTTIVAMALRLADHVIALEKGAVRTNGTVSEPGDKKP